MIFFNLDTKYYNNASKELNEFVAWRKFIGTMKLQNYLDKQMLLFEILKQN